MSKGKARILGYLFFGVASVCLSVNQYLLMILIGVPSLVLIWLYIHKDERDKNFVTEAQQERETSLQNPSSIPMMSKRSHRLSVPPSINTHE